MKTVTRTPVCSLWLTLVILGCLALDVESATGSVNNNGNITYGALPEGEGYSSPDSFDEGSFPLPTTWDFIGSFLSTVSPGSPPYDLINQLLGDPSSLDLSTLTGNILVYQQNLMGFAICCALGLLFCLIFPIVALCFCCCRCCCKNCGGDLHMEQRDNSCCRMLVYSLCLFVALTFVFAGAVTALCISQYTGEQATTLASRVNGNIDDLLIYVNNTLNEIDFVMTDQLGFTLDQVRDDLNDIGSEVGEPVREALRTNVQPAVDAIIAMETSIDNTLSMLQAIDTRQAGMEEDWETLSANLTTVLAALNATCMACSCCNNATGSLRNVDVVADYRDFNLTEAIGSYPQPLVTESLVSLTDISARNLSEQAQEGAQTFEDIPDTLSNTTASDIATIIETIDTLQETLNDFVNSTTSSLDGLSGQADGFQDTLDNFLTLYADNYDQYRAYVMYIFYGFILFIVALFFVGLIIGLCTYDRKVSPVNRTSCSNCGALFLMAGAGFVFVFGMPIMLITSLTFVIGGPIDRLVCDPLISQELFTETVDAQDAIIDGYYLGNLVFRDPDIPFTISGLLGECEQNQAVFTAFQLGNLINISQFTDISSQIPNVDDQFSNLTGDFSSVNIMNNETKQILLDFGDSPVDQINWTLFTNELAKDLIVDAASNINSLSDLIAAVTVDAAAASGSAQTNLSAHVADLQDIEDNLVAVLLADVAALQTEISDLTTETDGIDAAVNATIYNAERAQDFIDNNVADEVAASVSTYSDKVLGYPEQFVTYATNALESEIGGCRPVYNMWNQATNTLCVGILRSFNGLWFTMGWCIVFFIVALIFGVKLSKYFRTMETSDGYSDNADGFEMQGQQHYGNKIAPSYDADGAPPPYSHKGYHY